MTRYVLVPGTHSTLRKESQWWEPGSPFNQLLQRNGLTPARTRPFIWSSNLDGVSFWPWQWFRKDNHVDWKAAGEALISYLELVPYVEDRNLIAHSHGLQVVLYAAAAGMPINSLISVMSPVRGDMKDVAQAARPNIGRWLHLHSDKSDKMQMWGGLFDGQWGVHRTHPLADENQPFPGIGHSTILHPENMALWKSEGLIDFLKGPTP